MILSTLRLVLSDMATTTSAGQVYLMEKVVRGLETELERRTTALVGMERLRVRRNLDDLRRQAARPAPVASRFVDGAASTIDLLGAVTCDLRAAWHH